MSLHDRLVCRIAADGPMPIARYMATCAAHYYATRDPLGRDFTTAPEISQVFGELVGLWLADLWLRAGSPSTVSLVELGPGRGTLMADVLRATARVPGFREAVEVHLVETSPALRAEQAKRVPGVVWHDRLDDLVEAENSPILLVANEFLDALPIQQFVRVTGGWRERAVDVVGDRLVAVAGPRDVAMLVPPLLRDAPEGTVVETSPAATAVVRAVAERLRGRGGAALFVDYGYVGPAVGDTLQAMRGNAYADPFAEAGEADLTAHVDFAALGVAAAGLARVHGPVGQGAWLTALGIGARTEALAARAGAEQAALLRSGSERLTGAMGTLFKVLALTGEGWPEPAGF